MATYIITYDLSAPGRNYNDLYARIKSYGSFALITESTWAINTWQTADSVCTYLRGAMDGNDKLFVGTLSSPAYWYGLDPQITKWLQDNL